MPEHPWNNFLQLKAISIYEELLEHCGNERFRKFVLERSNLGPTLISMGRQAQYRHESDRYIRHGYMAVVTKLANLLTSHCDKQDVKEYINSLGEEWKEFTQGELKKTNDTNNRSLGGQQPRHSMDEEDNDNHYEVNMEKIMARFSNFNQLINSNNSNNEEEEENDD